MKSVVKNPKCDQKYKFWSKIENVIGQNSKFWAKIEIVIKNFG